VRKVSYPISIVVVNNIANTEAHSEPSGKIPSTLNLGVTLKGDSYERDAMSVDTFQDLDSKK
jgi:hypothetical protein